jgi:hypothetical protein
MITAQQARDIVFNRQVEDVEYDKVVKWVEEHIEPHILRYAEDERYTLFIKINDEEISPVAVRHALDRNGFIVTCANVELCKDQVHRIHQLRVSWK